MNDALAQPRVSPGILVVDDDPDLLLILEVVFQRSGFQVWTAASGEAAVTLYQEQQTQIDIVLLDVCMPGMDGPHTLAELRRVSASVRACFMSGFTGAYSIDDLTASGALQFFDKPFKIHDLTEQLWQLARPGQRRSA